MIDKNVTTGTVPLSVTSGTVPLVTFSRENVTMGTVPFVTLTSKKMSRGKHLCSFLPVLLGMTGLEPATS